MRVDRTGPSADRARPAAPDGPGRTFSSALARAREGPRGGDARHALPAGGRGGRGGTAAAGGTSDGAALPLAPQEPRAGAGPGAPPASGTQVLPATALASAVRALPPDITSPRPGAAGAPLTIAFGRALDVDLRSVPSGVAIVLRPEGRLLAAAEAELPRVVQALRARGVTVARAEVAGRGGGRRPR